MSPWGVFICKLDSADNLIWSNGFGRATGLLLRDMAATADGGFLILSENYNISTDVSFHYGSSFSSDMWLLKVDSAGHKLWSKVIGGTGDDIPSSVIPLANGGGYLTGGTSSNDYDCTGNHGRPGCRCGAFFPVKSTNNSRTRTSDKYGTRYIQKQEYLLRLLE